MSTNQKQPQRPLTQADIDEFKRKYPDGYPYNRMGAQHKKTRKPRPEPKVEKPKRGIAVIKGRPLPKLPRVSAPGTPLWRKIKETSAEIRRRRLAKIRNR